MDWMYKEHAKHEKSSPYMNNQSSINETEDRMCLNDKDKMSTQPTAFAFEGDVSTINTENTSNNQVGPDVPALDECTERDINSIQEPCGKGDFLKSILWSLGCVSW